MFSTPKSTTTEPNVRLKTIDVNSQKILTQNGRRIQALIQNNGTLPCLILLGSGTVSPTNYHFVLSPSSVARDGRGGSLIIDHYVGAVSAICEASTTILSVTELE